MSAATPPMTLAPPFAEWRPILSERSRRSDADLRGAVLEAARKFTASLPIGSSSAGDGTELLSGTKIAATGHQAVIYHPGILFKNHCIDQLSAAADTTALNLIVDTDASDCGVLRYPVASPSGPRLHAEHIAEGPEISFEQVMLSKDRISAAFSRVISALSELGHKRAAEGASMAKSLYEKVADTRAVIGNTAVRRALTGARHLELPVSALVRLPPISRMLAGWIADWERFSKVYNGTLHSLRAERGIRNRANPFPDLEWGERGAELPFWTIRDAKRDRLFVKEANGRLVIDGVGEISDVEDLAALISNGETLVAPRAVLISTLFRCHVSDLFVHGLGGARYDLFTDRFIQAYFAMTPPPFVVASATRRLFEDEVQRYEKEHIDSATFRKIVYHLGSYSDRPEIAAMPGLDDLIRDQESMISEIKSLKSRRASCGRETRRLKEHMLRVSAAVKEAFAGRTVGGTADPSYLSAIYCRELPFFFFDRDMFKGVPSATDQ